MARPAVIAAVFAIALVLVAVSGGDENSKQAKCRKQIKRLKLTHCEQYLIDREMMTLRRRQILQKQEQGEGQVGEEEEEEEEEKQLKPCCDELEKLGGKCRCMGLEQVVGQLRERGEMQGEEIEGMEDCARHLPSDCDLEPKSCKF